MPIPRKYQFAGEYVQDRKRFEVSGDFILEEGGKIKSGEISDSGSPRERRTLEGIFNQEKGKKKLILLISVPADNKFNIVYELESPSSTQSDSPIGNYEGSWLPSAKGEERRITSGPYDSKIGGPDFYGAKFLGPMTPSKEQMKRHFVTLSVRAA